MTIPASRPIETSHRMIVLERRLSFMGVDVLQGRC
jgi:hypothetical protein